MALALVALAYRRPSGVPFARALALSATGWRGRARRSRRIGPSSTRRAVLPGPHFVPDSPRTRGGTWRRLHARYVPVFERRSWLPQRGDAASTGPSCANPRDARRGRRGGRLGRPRGVRRGSKPGGANVFPVTPWTKELEKEACAADGSSTSSSQKNCLGVEPRGVHR